MNPFFGPMAVRIKSAKFAQDKKHAPFCFGTASSEIGNSIIELLVVMFLIAVLSKSAISNLAVVKNPLQDGTTQVLGLLKEVRAKSISTTSAYTLSADSSTRLSAEYANTCEATSWTADNKLQLDLPTGVHLTDTSWSVCFTSRGLANDSPTISLENSQGESKIVEVFLGGAVRIQP